MAPAPPTPLPEPEPPDHWFAPGFVEAPLEVDDAALDSWLGGGSWVVSGDGPAADALRSALNDRSAVIVDDLDAADAIAWVAGASDVEVTALLTVVQDLVDRQTPPPLYVLTTGAQAADRDVTTPGGSAIAGLLRVVAIEAPHLRTVTVDRSPDALEPEAWLAAWADGDPEQAFTDGRRFVRRLRPAPPPGPPTPPPPSALITGGLKGIGLALARRWARGGTERLVLVGRSTPSADAVAVIDEARARGCAVDVFQIDLADAERTKGLRSALGDGVHTVVHAAGALDDRALPSHDAQSFDTAFAPKVRGTRNLFAALMDRRPERMILMGAGAGLLGSPGQANYAAANAWLAGFARLTRRLGWPSVVVDWGPWSETGMAARLGADHASRQSAQGIRPVPLEEGLAAIDQVTADATPHLAYLDVDWATLTATVFGGHRPPVLAELVSQVEPAEPEAVDEALVVVEPSIPAPIEGENGAATQPLGIDELDELVARIAASLIGRGDLDRVKPLSEQGLDSLLAVQLKNELLDRGVDVPVGPLVTGPSIERIAILASGHYPSVSTPEQTALVPANRRRGPHPLITHLLAFLVGILFVVLGYALGFEVFGPRIGLPDASEERRSAVPSNALEPESFQSGSRSRRGTQP